MFVCCAAPFVCYGLTKWSEPDVLFFGDSGIDGWGAVDTSMCTFCCFDACIDATGNKSWQVLTANLKEKGLTHSHMGVNSAPASDLCCCAPFMLCKNKPKKYIVTMMGANDLVWHPCCFTVLCGANFPMCSFNLFMGHVGKYGNPELKVVFLPDQVGPRTCAPCHKTYYDKVKASAGTIITPINSTDDVDAPGWTYSKTTNESAAHQNLIYIDGYPAYDKLVEKNGNFFGGCEATLASYLHYSEWITHVVSGGGATASAEGGPAGAQMDRN